MSNKRIMYKTDMPFALAKLEKAIIRLGATELLQGGAVENGDYVHRITFRYKDEPYKFVYSKGMAQAKGYSISANKDVAIANINAINDLAKIADRGIYDFGKMIQGFKALTLIEVPSWASFMGFNSMPRNIVEVRTRYNELVKDTMNPERNPTDFKLLQQHWESARKFFKVD